MHSAILLKIRTITVGITLQRGESASWTAQIEEATRFNTAAAAAFAAAGYEVQTTRISTNSFEEWVDVGAPAAALDAMRSVDATLQRCRVDLFNAGPASSAAGQALVPDIIAIGPRISASGVVASALDAGSASRLAAAVLRVARETEGGEGNFQFCISANVPPNIPFFPAAYHAGPASFAVGCETSALVADAFPRAGGDLDRARALLIELFEAQMKPVERLALELSAAHALPYDGLDASVAPSPAAPSLTDAYASLGLGRFGESGTLAVSALLTGALKALDLKLCGYTGLMLPPLEDTGLARRATEGGYRIHDLLLNSAVCGLGLDTVPVPGDVPAQKLAALLLDVAALAYRLNKPLTARLFPVPGKHAGEQTEFKNPHLCNGAVFEVP